MDPGEESVAVLDEDGAVCGAAPRRVVRRDNLLHRATAVLVLNSLGQVYVHRRTSTKDVYPGRYDCCAGGVVGAGEGVEHAARRELAEELGIDGVEIVPLLVARYEDEHARYEAHVYQAQWDGPVRWQAEEVQSGEWMGLEDLAELVEDPLRPFVPDSRALLAGWLRDRLAERRASGA